MGKEPPLGVEVLGVKSKKFSFTNVLSLRF